MRNILVLVELSYEFNKSNKAHSSAGNQVQDEIIQELSKNTEDKVQVIGISHDPFPLWPKGPPFIKRKKNGNIIFPSYINIPIIKSLFFIFHYAYFSYILKPKLIVKYNTSLTEALVLKIIRFFGNVKLAIIIQDIVLPQNKDTLSRFKHLCNHLAVKICRNFDVLIPITNEIAKNYKFPSIKTIVFKGGVTRQTREILKAGQDNSYEELLDRAIFAGALEPYNGIDWLVKLWTDEKATKPLYVFGDGSLRYLLEEMHRTSNGKIIYMGVCDERTVSEFICNSKINICLRFSKGIKEEYFFPSKFINLCAAPGVLICNSFKNFPRDLVNHCSIINENLQECMIKIDNTSIQTHSLNHFKRIEWLQTHANWGIVIKEILSISKISNVPLK